MNRLTVPDERINEHTTRRTIIDCTAVRERAMEIYWRLKAYEDTGLDPEICAEYKKFEGEIVAGGKDLNHLIELLRVEKEGRAAANGCWMIGEIGPVGCAVKCSVCGWGFDNVDPVLWADYAGHKYCGNCGAKMNGEGERDV